MIINFVFWCRFFFFRCKSSVQYCGFENCTFFRPFSFWLCFVAKSMCAWLDGHCKWLVFVYLLTYIYHYRQKQMSTGSHLVQFVMFCFVFSFFWQDFWQYFSYSIFELNQEYCINFFCKYFYIKIQIPSSPHNIQSLKRGWIKDKDNIYSHLFIVSISTCNLRHGWKWRKAINVLLMCTSQE